MSNLLENRNNEWFTDNDNAWWCPSASLNLRKKNMYSWELPIRIACFINKYWSNSRRCENHGVREHVNRTLKFDELYLCRVYLPNNSREKTALPQIRNNEVDWTPMAMSWPHLIWSCIFYILENGHKCLQHGCFLLQKSYMLLSYIIISWGLSFLTRHHYSKWQFSRCETGFRKGLKWSNRFRISSSK